MALFGKIFGWVQFGLTAASQVITPATTHGWAGWVTSIASLAAAIGIHAASSSNGTN